MSMAVHPGWNMILDRWPLSLILLLEWMTSQALQTVVAFQKIRIAFVNLLGILLSSSTRWAADAAFTKVFSMPLRLVVAV